MTIALYLLRSPARVSTSLKAASGAKDGALRASRLEIGRGGAIFFGAVEMLGTASDPARQTSRPLAVQLAPAGPKQRTVGALLDQRVGKQKSSPSGGPDANQPVEA